jgi:hypothetical protein
LQSDANTEQGERVMATLRETSIDPIDYGPVMAALRKARAAWWLIDAFEHGYVQVRYSGLGVRAKQEAECGRIRDRVYHGALDDLEEALAEAEAALREAMTPEHPRSSRVALGESGA